jgi:hypothetical protein
MVGNQPLVIFRKATGYPSALCVYRFVVQPLCDREIATSGMKALMAVRPFQSAWWRTGILLLPLFFAAWSCMSVAVYGDETEPVEAQTTGDVCDESKWAHLSSELERVTQDFSYCTATSRATEIRERILLERIEHMEEQSFATTCSNNSTEEIEQLQEMVSQLRQALKQSQQTVQERTTEHQTMQSTIDALKEELNTHKAALDEKNRQLDDTLAQSDEIALNTKLLRLRVDDLESQRNAMAAVHSLAIEQARQEGKRVIQARLTFWMQQYHVLETTTVALAHEQRQAAVNALEMCQAEKFELRYAWHLARERDRAVVLRRQLQWQTYVMEPYEWFIKHVTKPSLEWLSVQPDVVVLLRKWDTLVSKHVPRWERHTAKWISVTYQDAIEPRVSEWWFRVQTTCQQVEQFYTSVVAPLPVVKSFMASHAAVIHGTADLLTIGLQSNMPPVSSFRDDTILGRGLQWVQEHATQLIMCAEIALPVYLVAVLFRRRNRPKKP